MVLLVAGSGLSSLLPAFVVGALIWVVAVWLARHVLDLTSLVAGLRRSPTRAGATSLS